MAASIAAAQAPDVRFRADIGLTLRGEDGGRSTARFYNTLGRPSTVSLIFFLEPGLRAVASQRLELLDDTPLGGIDEAFVEDQATWKIGKQYLPFGYGRLMAESVMAARMDTDLIFEGVPIAFAAFDAGRGFNRGAVVRLGSPSLSLSAGIGEHLGISGTALNAVRRPEDHSGKNGGFKQAYVLEASRGWGQVRMKLEAAYLGDSHVADDPNLFVADLSATWNLSLREYYLVGLSVTDLDEADTLRFAAGIGIDRQFDLEPMVRFRRDGFYDASVTLRFRF